MRTWKTATARGAAGRGGSGTERGVEDGGSDGGFPSRLGGAGSREESGRVAPSRPRDERGRAAPSRAAAVECE